MHINWTRRRSAKIFFLLREENVGDDFLFVSFFHLLLLFSEFAPFPRDLHESSALFFFFWTVKRKVGKWERWRGQKGSWDSRNGGDGMSRGDHIFNKETFVYSKITWASDRVGAIRIHSNNTGWEDWPTRGGLFENNYYDVLTWISRRRTPYGSFVTTRLFLNLLVEFASAWFFKRDL